MMREKYIEERHPYWFNMDTMGCDIDTPDTCLGTAQSTQDCDDIINAHNELVTSFVQLAQAFDKADSAAFNLHWYGGRL